MDKKNRSIGVDDYVGTVGHERHAIHQTHFSPTGVRLPEKSFDTGYEWVEVSTGKWVRVKKEYTEI